MAAGPRGKVSWMGVIKENFSAPPFPYFSFEAFEVADLRVLDQLVDCCVEVGKSGLFRLTGDVERTVELVTKTVEAVRQIADFSESASLSPIDLIQIAALPCLPTICYRCGWTREFRK